MRAEWIHVGWAVPRVRGKVKRPECRAAGQSGAAGGFVEGAVDHRSRLADDARGAAADELADGRGRRDFLLFSCHLHNAKLLPEY